MLGRCGSAARNDRHQFLVAQFVDRPRGYGGANRLKWSAIAPVENRIASHGAGRRRRLYVPHDRSQSLDGLDGILPRHLLNLADDLGTAAWIPGLPLQKPSHHRLPLVLATDGSSVAEFICIIARWLHRFIVNVSSGGHAWGCVERADARSKARYRGLRYGIAAGDICLRLPISESLDGLLPLVRGQGGWTPETHALGLRTGSAVACT